MIAAESGYEREIATALQAGEIPVRMHPLSIKRAGEYGGQRGPLWQWLDQGQQRQRSEPGLVP